MVQFSSFIRTILFFLINFLIHQLTQVTNRINTCTNNGTRAESSWAEMAESGIQDYVNSLIYSTQLRHHRFDNHLLEEPRVGTPIRQSLFFSAKMVLKNQLLLFVIHYDVQALDCE